MKLRMNENQKVTLSISQLKRLVKESKEFDIENEDIGEELIRAAKYDEIKWQDLINACLQYSSTRDAAIALVESMDEDDLWKIAQNKFDYKEKQDPATEYEVRSSRGGRTERREFDELYEAGNSSNTIVGLDGSVPEEVWYVNVSLKNEDWYEGLFTSAQAARRAVDEIDEDEIDNEADNPVRIIEIDSCETAKELNNAISDALY